MKHPFHLRRKAARLFPQTDFPPVKKSSRRYMQRAWLNSIELLGDKWLFANHIERKL